MKNYEFIGIINPDISEEETGVIVQKIKDFVISTGGSITRSQELARKSLGVKIKQKKEAFIVSFVFCYEPEKMQLLMANFKSEGQILRFMVAEARNTNNQDEGWVFRKRRSASKENSASSNSSIELKPESQKVEIQEIDKKIEEILSE